MHTQRYQTLWSLWTMLVFSDDRMVNLRIHLGGCWKSGWEPQHCFETVLKDVESESFFINRFFCHGFSSIHTKTWPTLISEGFSWCEWLQPARGQTAQERPRRLWARHDLHFANQKVKRETEWNRMEKCRNHLKPLENCLRRWSCSCRGSPGA